MEKRVITQFNRNYLCKSIVFLICYIFLVQSCIWIMPLSSAWYHPASPEKYQGIFSEIAEAFNNALDLFLPTEAYAAPPRAICVPWYPTDLLVPHETWPGKPTILKGVSRDVDNNLSGGTYYWDFGDGTSSSPAGITNPDNLSINHIYNVTSGTLIIARLHVTDTAGETSSDEYRILVKEKTLDVEVNKAIDDGLWWLYTQKESVGSSHFRWNNSRTGNHYANTTASAVQAFEINGHLETGNPDEDPYVNVVRGGIDYLLTVLTTYNMSLQDGEDPDSNHNGIGLSVIGDRPIYETGAVMDAFVASGTPDAIARAGGINVIGRRYHNIVQDMVDMYSWGQSEAVTDLGGWQYTWNYSSDNSASQWGAIGMVAAERHFGCIVPQWVKDRNNVWLNFTYNTDGYFGYKSTRPNNPLSTGPCGMVQLSFAGKDITDYRWIACERYIVKNWSRFLSTSRDCRYYSFYAFAKAMRLALPQEVTHLAATGLDWYGDETQGLARHLVNNQNSDGSWPYDGWPYIGERTAAGWNIIILTRTLFERPPVAIIHANPNPGAIGQVINLDASDSYHVDPSKEITGYLWDFDASDGVNFDNPDAIDIQAPNAFGALGNYVVSLKVIDNSIPVRFDISTQTIRITIPPHAPTAVVGGPYISAVGEEAHVDGSGSYDVDEPEGDSITAWDWETDFAAPYDFDEAHGEKAVLPLYSSPGHYDIALRVTDNTATVFPDSGQPNLTHVAYGGITVYRIGVADLQARPKATKCQLTWTHIGMDLYEVLRSEKGPNEGFELIGTTNSTYSTYLDYNVELKKDYWYRIRTTQNGEVFLSGPVHVNSIGRIRNYPPVITSVPVTDAQEAILYQYDVEASDPEGTALTYILDQSPDGMTIDAATGLINWTPNREQAGLNDITVRVRDVPGASATQFFQVLVAPRPNTPPVSNPGGPYSGLTGEAITFDGSGSFDPEGDPITDYHWVFGDGTEAHGMQVTHTYTASGMYTVTLYVTDDRSATGSAETTCQIEAPNQTPIANAGGPYHGHAWAIITFDGSGSSDPDGDALTYTWNFGDSMPPETGVTISHIFPLEGTYTVTLTVDDGRGGLDTDSVDVVIDPPNEAPDAEFTGSTFGNVGDEFAFDASSSGDPDGSIISYEWDFNDGSTTTGMIVTHVFNAQGHYTVSLTVTDDDNAEDTATLEVHINAPPEITSTPETIALEDALYTYDTEADDVDGDTLTYSLTQAPSGMTIDSLTGLIQWTPVQAQLGDNPVTISVNDGNGRTVTQSFVIDVQNVNDVPQIISSPVTTAIEDTPYTYDVDASDEDGDTLTFVLSLAPSGMTIASDTGLIQWQPVQSHVGIHDVTVIVSDGHGGTDTQSYSLTVENVNDPPEIISTPITIADVDVPYTYDVEASDMDGDTVQYSLDISPPAMTIDSSTGLIQWTPINPDVGDHTIRVKAGDPSGAFDTQEYTLTVRQQIIDNTPPRMTDIIINPLILNPGDTATITIDAIDNEEIGSYALKVDNIEIPLTGNTATYTAIDIGVHIVEAFVCDTSGNCSTLMTQFGVRDPSDTTPPVVSIQSPIPDSKITCPTDFIGTVSDINLLYYVLEYSEKDKNNYVPIFKGYSEVFNDILGTFDPTLLFNGLYDVRLSAVDVNGLTNSISFTTRVTGDLKVGNFTVTLKDLEIPVAGIPITIYRTYDSRIRHNKGDFGYGWNIDIRTTKAEENREPGEGWYQQSSGGFMQTYYLLPDGDHYVSITLPDGQTLEFDCKFMPESQFLIPIQWVDSAVYTPRPGTNGSLVALDDDPMYFDGSQVLNWDFNVYNPSRYQLTTMDGTVYIIDQTEGLKRVVDNNGNSLDITYGGIIHSTGKSITFTRDAQGRITQITDPMGNIILYDYDGEGNLVAMTDQEGNTSQYTYNSNHGLVDIFDPTGNRPMRNEYDYDGRLIAHMDAEGNRIEYTHDPNNRQEIISDRLGNITVFEYDDNGNVTKKTDPLGNVTSYTYDARGNKLSETDPLGNTTINTYDAKDNMLTQTDPLGNTKSYTYNARGQVLTVTDPLGNVTSNTYDAKGNLLASTDPLGNTTTNTYNTNGNLTGTTDALGNVSSYAYDSYGNMISQTNPLGNMTTYTYDNNGNQLTQTVTRTTPSGPETIMTTNVYDSLNRIISSIDPYGNSATTEYNAIGKQSAATDKNGNRTEYEYDSRGNLVKTTFPDGTTETAAYDAEGRKTIFTDRAGRTTLYIFDALDRLIQTIYPDGSSTTTTYDAAGRVIAQTDERGNTTNYTYDAAGRRTSVIDPLGNATTYTYDAKGNQLSMTDAKGHIFVYEYDKNNRRIKTIFNDGTFTSITYDALGRKVTETDHAGIITQFHYDALGRLIKVTDAFGQNTTYTYDELGNKIFQTDANGNTTTWEFDRLGRVTKRTLPLGMSETMTYDAAGNMITKTDFNGDTINYSYNNNNCLILKSYPDSSTVSFAYTPTGQRASILDPRGLTTYVYDLRDRLIQRTDPDGIVISYTYDAAGNRTSVTVPSGTTTYAFDGLNRLMTVTDPDAGITAYTYDAVGNRASVIYPNGTKAVYTYDTLNRLIRLENKRSDDSIISSYDYTLGPSGNRIRVQENTGRIVDYTYDALYRLTQESITDPSLGNRIITYTYDPVGNRLLKGDTVAGPTNYAYDENDRLLTENGTIYTYDNNGNTISKTEGLGVTTYNYDYENRLVVAQTPAATVNYAYDVDGIRVSSSVDGIVTNYLVDKNRDYAQVLEERDGGAGLIASYVYGDDLIAMNRSGIVSFYQYDGNGNTRQLTDALENITDVYVYDAFGIMLDRTGTTINNYLYTGEQYDANVGFYYLRARYYNHGIGRFLTQDEYKGSIYEIRSLHKYLYVSNNPVNDKDLSGYMSISSVAVSLVVWAIVANLVVRSIYGFLKPLSRRGSITDLSKEEFYKEMKQILKDDILTLSQSDKWNYGNYMLDSKFWLDENLRETKYRYDGMIVFGHELNYYVQGMLYRHWNMFYISTYFWPTAWKMSNTAFGRKGYYYPPSSYTYYFTLLGWDEYERLKSEVEPSK